MLDFSTLHQSIAAPCSTPCALQVLPTRGVYKELVASYPAWVWGTGNSKAVPVCKGAAHITGMGSRAEPHCRRVLSASLFALICGSFPSMLFFSHLMVLYHD